MIAQDAPVLETRNRMFDARSATTVTTPGSVTHHAASSEDRCDELGHTTISAVGEHATMRATQPFDVATAVMNGIVAVAWASRDDSDHA